MGLKDIVDGLKYLSDKYIGNESDFTDMFFELDEFYRRTIEDKHPYRAAKEVIAKIDNGEAARLNLSGITARLAYFIMHQWIDLKAHWYWMVDGTFFNRTRWYDYMLNKIDNSDLPPEVKEELKRLV